MEFRLEEVPMGRLVIGVYRGRKHVMKKIKAADGSVTEEVVPGMWEVNLECRKDYGTSTPRLSYSETDYDGEVSRFQERVILPKNEPQNGDLVALSFASRGTTSGGKAYVNDTPIDVRVLAPAGTFDLDAWGAFAPSEDE